MINMESVRRLLAIADAAKDPYAVAEVAASLLAANSSDSVAAGHYARALSVLQLYGAAHRVVGGPPPAHASGIIRWASRARRFAANLAALESRDPHGAELVREAAAELERYELHAASDGNFQILDTTQPIHAGWLGNLANHKATERLWQFDAAKCPMPFPIVFEGAGFGWLLLHVLKTTERSYLNYSCAVYIVDADPLAIAVLLHLHDLQEVIGDPRIRWFVGRTPEETLAAFRKALEENNEWTVPEQWVRSALRVPRAVSVEATILEIAGTRRRRNEKWAADAKAFYAAKDLSYWQQRYEEALSGRGEPLRVLGLTSRYTTVLRHSMTEMQEAVRAAGHEMIVAMEPDDHSVENPYLELLTTYKPDLLFQISRLRYENPAMPLEIPFLCWDQDNLPSMRTAAATESLDALTYVAGHAASYGHTFLKWPRRNLVFCHPAGATFRYSGTPAAPELLARHACDISFISNASGTPEEVREQQRPWWKGNAAVASLYEKVSQTILTRMGDGATWEFWSLQRELREAANRQGLQLAAGTERELNMALTSLADRCFRHAALGWVRGWCEKRGHALRLYGNGWERHADFARYAAGYARQGDELAAIHQASKINLHLMESGGFIHSRPLDGLAAGGFFLTRACPNDGLETRYVDAQRILASRAEILGLATKGDLDHCTDPAVADAWAVMQHFFVELGPDDPITGLSLWNELPTARTIFPQLAQISFSNAAEFETLAEKYLADEAARRDIARAMREVVLRDMSYARRWTQFREGLRKGLAAAVEPAAAMVCTND